MWGKKTQESQNSVLKANKFKIEMKVRCDRIGQDGTLIIQESEAEGL